MRKIIILSALFLGLFALPALSNNEAAAEAKTYTPDKKVVYKTTPQGELELHIFYPAEEKKAKSLPVVVQFFGGGWVSGNPNQFYQQSAIYNEQDMVAISVDYRTKNKHKTSPFECVEDGKSAIRWIRENAKELGIDPNKIIASGGSAGGHIAACTALIEGYEAKGENLKISSVPNALILFNPVLDTTKDGYGANKLVGKETLISPTHHVHKIAAPTIVMHGTKDTTVPFANAKDFTAKMKECGNECELVPFPGLNHGFFNGTYFRKKGNDNNFDKTMTHAIEFLKKYKFIK